jgi:hypothetical protein
MADTIYKVKDPQGNIREIKGPAGASDAEVLAKAKSLFAPKKSAVEELAGFNLGDVKNAGMGALRGASRIGTTLMRPVDAALNATGLSDRTNVDRKASIEQFFGENADTNSLAFQGGDIGAQIAGTAGVGGLLGKGVMGAAKAVPALSNVAPKVATALETGGLRLNPANMVGPMAPVSAMGTVGNAALRTGAGAVTGGAMAGLADPGQAGMGAAIGGALPGVVKGAGLAGQGVKKALGGVSDDVVNLYNKAKSLGIDIPADRIVNNRPLNAIAASLDYVPFSGRAGTMDKMFRQMNQALSRTFGQDSPNVTMALRKASVQLGKQFDDVLSKNAVKVDDLFLDDIARNMEKASKELAGDGLKVIGNQVDEIINKTANGQIDARAAYNIKKTLDRIGARNSNEAYYARELKKSLMSALNRSLGPDDAANFAKVRKQYGTMLDLEGLAQNGAEGGISVGRLANMKNINNPDLQDLADIASQFLKSREAPHGAAQRIAMGLGAAAVGSSTGTLPLVGAGIAGGRGINMALNSSLLKQGLVGQSQLPAGLLSVLENPATRSGLLSATNP